MCSKKHREEAKTRSSIKKSAKTIKVQACLAFPIKIVGEPTLLHYQAHLSAIKIQPLSKTISTIHSTK